MAPKERRSQEMSEQVRAANEEKKRQFYEAVQAARAKRDEPPPPPPAPTVRQLEQTKREMEAGQRAVARAEEAKKIRPPPPRAEQEKPSTPVFRPGDYVPDPRKNQGNIKSSILSNG